MEAQTLGEALEQEHRQIDGGIESYVASLNGCTIDGGMASAVSTTTTEPLLLAMAGLRRHIYLEEAFLFPPLQAAGLMGPIFVMLREHGQLWRQLDSLDHLLKSMTVSGFNTEPSIETLRSACLDLLSLLNNHNSKEEPIIYTQADGILDAQLSQELHDFLARGTMPDGWVCKAA